MFNKENLQKAASVASISAAISVAPMVANAADFSGSYADPKHPSCLRVVEVKGNKAAISGTDGNPGCPPDGSGKKWNLEGKINGNEILVDFSPKVDQRIWLGNGKTKHRVSDFLMVTSGPRSYPMPKTLNKLE